MRLLAFSFLAAACLSLPATAQTLERIQETGKLNLGYRTDAAPLSYQNAEGNPAGYAPLICVHVGQAIANQLKMETLDAEFVPVGADDRFDKVASGEIDILCGAATITLSRREVVDFSDPIYVDGTAVLLPREGSDMFADLAGKKIGVHGSTTTEDALRYSLMRDAIVADVITFDSHEDGRAAMQAQEIDAYFADQSILAAVFLTAPDADQFKMSNEIMTIEKQGLAMARGDADFRLLVDSALSDLYGSGKMQELFREAMPGAQPGAALQAMYLIAPTVR